MQRLDNLVPPFTEKPPDQSAACRTVGIQAGETEQRGRKRKGYPHVRAPRVGRGDRAVLFFFFVEGDPAEIDERLKVFVEANDGFRIAERDLELRGGGEVQGVRQSGQGRFLLARPLSDLETFHRLSEHATARLARGVEAAEGRLLRRIGRYLGPDRPLQESQPVAADGPLAATRARAPIPD